MKICFTFLFFFAFLSFQAQEITDKETFKKCKKELSKKICLSDEDKDGVVFYLDQCPKDFGDKENEGCPFPDTDGDGVLDKDDACPDVPGPVENNGCPWPDTDGDGVLDKDDACPTVPGIAENNGCPKKIIESHRYTKEELDEVEKEFLEKTKDIDYNKLADFIFSKISEKDFKSKLITIKVASFSQMAGCGLDRTDYSPVNLIVNIASEKFWNEKNVKKFAVKFPNKLIVLISENERVNKKVQNFQNIFSKKIENITFYNSKNNFSGLNLKEINYEKALEIIIKIGTEDNLIVIRIGNNYERKNLFFLKKEKNNFIEIKNE